METNTNTPEAKQPASAGCPATTCLSLCAYCRKVVPKTYLYRVCLPCQRKEMRWNRSPKNFEGERWQWHEVRYAPIQMCYGTIQSRSIEWTAKRAWETFEKDTGRTREELKRDGYRVKRITITPAWGSNSQANVNVLAPAGDKTPNP